MTSTTTTAIFAARFWGLPSEDGFPELARRAVRKAVDLGWTHEDGYMVTPSGDRRDECGCPDCCPQAYGN